jgi:type VI secretion system secreted protein VgrG
MSANHAFFGDKLRFFFKIDYLLAPAFNVVKFEGTEAISKLFRFEIILVSNNGAVDLEDMLHHPATLTVNSNDGGLGVPYHGILSEFEQLGQTSDLFFYRAVLVPTVWRLSLTKLNDIFTDESTDPQIIQSVLSRNSLAFKDAQMNLNPLNLSAYRPRSFVCQYQESDLGFISRLMEHNGLYYYFEHALIKGAYRDKLVITDYKESHPILPLILRYTAPADLPHANIDQCITSFTARQNPLPQKVVVQDFNYRKAGLSIEAEASVSLRGHGEVLFEGLNVRTQSEAQHFAQIRAQEIACHAKVFTGQATAAGVRSGHMIVLTNHFRLGMNGAYLVTEVRHHGTQAALVLEGQTTEYIQDGESGTLYTCSFKCIPATTQFRPERLTPRPIIHGTKSAIIDGEGFGQKAEIDKFGQYKVQLTFDRKDRFANKGSAWVRMMSPYVGDGHGMRFNLLKGTEVQLAFVNGDPDQPIIVGAVSNSEQKNVTSNATADVHGMLAPSGSSISMVEKPGAQSLNLYSPTAGSYLFIGKFPSIPVVPSAPAAAGGGLDDLLGVLKTM